MNGQMHISDVDIAVRDLAQCNEAIVKAMRVARSIGNGVTAFNEASGMNLSSKDEADAIGPVALKRVRLEAVSKIRVMKDRYGIVIDIPAEWPQ